MDAVNQVDAKCEHRVSEPTIPTANVIARWLDEDLSADAERLRAERADTYSVYMKDSGSKGPL